MYTYLQQINHIFNIFIALDSQYPQVMNFGRQWNNIGGIFVRLWINLWDSLSTLRIIT